MDATQVALDDQALVVEEGRRAEGAAATQEGRQRTG
jgi:hypothetical protein